MDSTPVGVKEQLGDVDALMAASRVFTAVVARSMTGSDRAITTAQLRFLVVLDQSGPVNLSGLAEGLGVDTSTASRTCDQLVRAKLVLRSRDQMDRRHVTLRLSHRGTTKVERLMARRREVFAEITDMMRDEDRADLARALETFVAAAGRLGPGAYSPTASKVDGAR